MPRPCPLPALMAVVLVSGLLATATPAASASRPDLVVGAIEATTSAVEPGEKLKVAGAVLNRGRGKAAASRVSVSLSADARPGKDVRLGLLRTAAVPARSGAPLSGSVKVPGGLAAGDYHLVACADANKAVRESKEGNNCRVSGSSVRGTGVVTQLPDPALTGVFPLDPDPVAVTTRATSETVQLLVPGPGFGAGATEESVTGPDGTTYTLSVPAGATLGSPWTTLTMTVVESVSGSPLGGLVGGVQLEPHGLVLLEPATLRVDPAGAAPGGVVAFTADGDGGDLRMLPTDGSAYEVPIAHFSTVGVAEATPAQQQALAAAAPSGDTAQLESALSTAPSSDQVALAEAHHHDVVQPALDAAERATSLDAALAGVATALSWGHHVAVLGLSSAYLDAASATLVPQVVRILVRQIDRAEARCADHDLSAFRDLLRIARMLALFGEDAASERAAQAAVRCGRFEVAMTATERLDLAERDGTYSRVIDGDWTVELPPTVLAVALDNPFISASPALVPRSVSYRFTESDVCPDGPGYESDVRNDAYSAGQALVRLDIAVDLYDPAQRDPLSEAGFLEIAVQQPPIGTSTGRIESCYGPGQDVSEPELGWAEAFFELRVTDPARADDSGFLRIPLFADEAEGARMLQLTSSRTTQRPDTGEVFGESLSVTLDHRPR
ncbi:unannotated protein [freshwater metagenome]|uniref:Unannotated protein n=1 Tax=freshwater metagenome TaxID=449393 RepID=A0A6J6VWQ8_9ZZZZ|nr:hypothetical protein [Actinomycetota bacterium]